MNRHIKSNLANLPYREMVELSRELSAELAKNTITDESIADALSSLAQIEDTEFAKKEQDMLHSMFVRKKSITVQRFENGYKISIGAQNIDVYCDNVRDGISQALDNMVALKALS